MKTAGAVLIAALVFVFGALLLLLVGAFSLRSLLGVATYRSSGARWIVLIGAPVGAAVLSALSFRRVASTKR